MKTDVYDVLVELLSNEHVLYINLRNAHWNVKGPNFLNNHKYFQELYGESEKIIDNLAEQIKIIGFDTPASLKFFIENKTLSDFNVSDFNFESFVKQLIVNYEEYINTLSLYIENIDFDKGLENYLIGLLESRQKELWILKSHL